MYSKFLSLEPEKRERIIGASFAEFARKGFKNASTNEIVKKANISKGLLFHYFKNKKGLYLFLVDYSRQIFLNEFYSRLDYKETDIMERWKQICILKLELIRKYPAMYDFIIGSATEDTAELKSDLDSRNKDGYEEAFQKVFENMDTSKFKEGVDKKCVSEIIFWVAQGYSNTILEKIKREPTYRYHMDIDALIKEFDRYIELLKRAFYK